MPQYCLLAPGHKVRQSVLECKYPVAGDNPNWLLLRKCLGLAPLPAHKEQWQPLHIFQRLLPALQGHQDICCSMHWHTAGTAVCLINRFCKRNFPNLLLPNLQCASVTRHNKPWSMSELCWGDGGAQELQQLWLRLAGLSHCLPSLMSTWCSPELHRPFCLSTDFSTAMGAGMHNGLKTWGLKKGAFTFPGLISP